jgi:hypothetical protein
MSSFTEPLTVTKTGDNTWKVERAFRYDVGEENSGDYVDVPAGFETDFASVPRPLWAFFPPDGRYTQAAVVHDYLYNQRHIHGRKRSECDAIFLEAMGVLGVNWFKRHTMYRAVRSFGWIPWNKK